MIRRGLVTIVLFAVLGTAVTLVTWRALHMKTTLLPDVAMDEPEEEPEEDEDMPAGPVLHVPSPPPERQETRRVLERPLVVASFGWDLAAPALVANAGKTPSRASAFAPSGLAVSIQMADSLDGIVEGLVLGGGDDNGVDVAVLPLPQWLSVQDRLHTVDPAVFFVAGWSHGRESVFVSGHGTVTRPVRVSFDSVDAAYLALFGLDAEGIPPHDVELVAKDADPAPRLVAADTIRLPATGVLRPLVRWTTAEASGLIPIVMVASRPWAESHVDALVTWLRGWMFGVGEVTGRLPEAARRLGTMEGAPGALQLIRGMESWEPCSLKANLALFELDGPEAQPLSAVVRHMWQLLYQARLAAPVPRVLPISSKVVEAAERSGAPTDVGTSTAWSAWTHPIEVAGGERAVITRPLGDVDGHRLAEDIARLGSAFPKSTLRVTPKEEDGPIQPAFALARQLAFVPQSVVLAEPNPDLSTAGTLEVLLTP